MSPSFLCRPLYLGHRALLTYRRVVATSPGAGGAANSLFAQQGRYACCCMTGKLMYDGKGIEKF